MPTASSTFHVPSAYLAMQLYALMAIGSAIGLVWRMKLAYAIAAAVAPVGLAFTGLALATGMLWGKPMWGAYWSWGDARLTSVLVMFFLYLGYMLLHASLEERSDRGPCGRHSRCCGRGEPSDHQVLGGMVEQPAPGPDHFAPGGAGDHLGYAVATAGHDCGRGAVFTGRYADPGTGGSAAARAGLPLGARRGGGGRMSEFLAMGGYGAFVWPCVGLSFAVLAGTAMLTARRRLQSVHRRIRHLNAAPEEGAWELRVPRAGESRA